MFFFDGTLGAFKKTDLVKAYIDTGDSPPVRSRIYQPSPHDVEDIKKIISDLLEQQIIEVSDSQWRSSALFLRKKDGKLRMVLDLRELNKVTRKIASDLPSLASISHSMHGVQVFSSFDCHNGYFSVALGDEESKDRTTFGIGSNANCGTAYRLRRLPQGLSSSAGIFQRLSNIIMAGMPSTVLNYLDDYVCGTHTSLNQPGRLDEHIGMSRKLFARLRTAGVGLKPSKCNLFQGNVEYVGYKLRNDGLLINDKKHRENKKFETSQTNFLTQICARCINLP